MPERIGLLPLGELHAASVCAYCGVEGLLWERTYDGMRERGLTQIPLKRTVHRATLAIAHVCVDASACERRRARVKLERQIGHL